MQNMIIEYCLKTRCDNPLELTQKLMRLPNIPMHGPIHHLIIPSALITAYSNKIGNIDLAKALEEAQTRSSQVPGAVCGHWGICGASIGVGIYLSIIKKIGPLSEEEWKNVGQLTSLTANKISAIGGPRCCKRDGFTAIIEAINYSNKYLNTNYQINNLTCSFFTNNKQCKQKKCPFYFQTEKA